MTKNNKYGDLMSQSEAQLEERLEDALEFERVGKVIEIAGSTLRAIIPDTFVGESCLVRRVDRSLLETEVIGFDRKSAILMPLKDIGAVAFGAEVRPSDNKTTIPCGDELLGRVINALGEPIDGKGNINYSKRAPLMASAPNAGTRRRISKSLQTGVRAIDGLLTIGVGQRIGVFASAGVGKSTLLGQIARNIDADRVIVALIGERGREVREFIQDNLGEEGLAKSTVVVSTSNESALLRLRAAYAATAIAEAERDAGKNVVLMMDSVTRFARAQRDVGLSAGEPPGRQNFPASVYAAMPSLFERAGQGGEGTNAGSITGIYTVLVTGANINDDAVADEAKSNLDGHIVLSDGIKHFPRIDVSASVSRLRDKVVDAEHEDAARLVCQALKIYQDNYKDYKMGVIEDELLLQIIAECEGPVRRFLEQGGGDAPSLSVTRERLLADFVSFRKLLE